MACLFLARYESMVIFADVCVPRTALYGTAECATVQFDESGGGFCARWDAVGDVEFRTKGGGMVGPSVDPFFFYLAFV
jgi:hypothetical protein